MRIVFLSASGGLGGAERSLLDIVAAWRASGAEYTVTAVLAASGPLAEKARALGADVRLLPFPDKVARLGDAREASAGRQWLGLLGRLLAVLPSALRYLWRLRTLLQTLRPDVVHANGLKMHMLGALVTPRGAFLVWHLRDFLGLRPVAAGALRLLSRRADQVIGISQAVAADARRYLPGVPLDVVYNGIDTVHFSPAPEPRRETSEIRIGLVATFARWKGQDVFLQAIQRVIQRAPDQAWRFFLIGGPVYAASESQFSRLELQRLAASLGVGDRIEMIGFQEEPLAVFQTLDVVVHASTRPEPFGRTIAEAMACGRAVVAAKDGGVVELIEDGVTGLLVPPGDSAALAEAMIRLASDAGLRRRLGQAARVEAQRAFTRERLGAEVAEVYKALHGRQAPRRGRATGREAATLDARPTGGAPTRREVAGRR